MTKDKDGEVFELVAIETIVLDRCYGRFFKFRVPQKLPFERCKITQRGHRSWWILMIPCRVPTGSLFYIIDWSSIVRLHRNHSATCNLWVCYVRTDIYAEQ